MSIREINILDNPAIEYYYMQREKKMALLYAAEITGH